jgi:hypothetical protein
MRAFLPCLLIIPFLAFADEVGRYQIVSTQSALTDGNRITTHIPVALLLDTASGRSWMLSTTSTNTSWVPVLVYEPPEIVRPPLKPRSQ